MKKSLFHITLQFYQKIYYFFLLHYTPLKLYRKELPRKINDDLVKIIEQSPYFDVHYYRSLLGVNMGKKSLAIHYLYIGFKKGLNPSSSFSGQAYEAMYSDIEIQGICPLLHYELHGQKEGRMIFSCKEIEKSIINQKDLEQIRTISKQKRTFLLISHELSQTGAPRALFNLAIVIKKLGGYPVILSIGAGALFDEVVKSGISCKVAPLAFNECFNKNFYEITQEYILNFELVLFNTIVVLHKVENIKSLPIKKVCWIHDGAYGFSCCPNTDKFPYYYSLYDSIYVVGNYTKKVAETYGKGKFSMQNLLYGIDDISSKSLLSEEKKQKDSSYLTMVLAGTIDKRKGQDILIESLDLIPHDILNQLKIIIVGSPADSTIVDKIKNCPHACVILSETLAHDKLLELFASMDMLICPSIDDPMPIVCTEAMMFSKPVIVSENTGTASLITHGVHGYVIKPNNPDSLAESIIQAVQAKESLPAMGKKARQIYEQYFTSEIFEKRVRELFLF